MTQENEIEKCPKCGAIIGWTKNGITTTHVHECKSSS